MDGKVEKQPELTGSALPLADPVIRINQIQMTESESAYFAEKSEDDLVAKNAQVFLEKMNRDIDNINQAILTYHRSNRLEDLNRIHDLFQNIQDQYPGDIMTGISQYHTEIHVNLWGYLQAHPRPEPMQPSSPISRIAEVIDRISVHKMSELAHLLSMMVKGKSLNLGELYPETDHSEEAARFRLAFPEDQVSIQFLGGANAKNFLITVQNELGEQIQVVLKLDHRFGIPKDMERVAREDANLQEVFVPVYADRQALFTTDAENTRFTTCSMVLTQYCDQGDLETYLADPANFPEPDGVKKRVDSAIEIYLQMIEILKDFEEKKIAFPDMKNANWLIEKDVRGKIKLKLSDTKSFIPTQDDGNIHWSKTAASGHKAKGEIMTMDYSPFEAMSKESFSGSKMHTFILGANLLQYLSGVGVEEGIRPALLNILDEDDLQQDLEKYPIFTEANPLGRKVAEDLRTLVSSMLTASPKARPSLDEVAGKLRTIQQQLNPTTNLRARLEALKNSPVISIPDVTPVDKDPGPTTPKPLGY